MIGKIPAEPRESVYTYGKVPDPIYVGTQCNDVTQFKVGADEKDTASQVEAGVSCTIRRDLYSVVPVASVVEATADEFV